MSGNELINEVEEGVVETVTEVSNTKYNVLCKVAIAGAVVAAGVVVVKYIKKKRAEKLAENETVEVVEEKNSKKSEK